MTQSFALHLFPENRRTIQVHPLFRGHLIAVSGPSSPDILLNLQIVLSTYADCGVISHELANQVFKLFDVCLAGTATLVSPALFTLAPDVLVHRLVGNANVESKDPGRLGVVLSEVLLRLRPSMVTMIWCDWKRSPLSAGQSSSSRLRRFELSITASASTTLPDVLALLAGSRETLVSLTLRNKGATSASAKTFLPISQGLISAFARTLQSLTVKNIPRYGTRLPSSPPTWSWFPPCPASFPHLSHLQLTGLPSLSPAFFRSTVHLPAASQLHRLTLEDFDSLSTRPLLEALQGVPALQGLRLLEVALGREADAREEDREGWGEGTQAVERWCEGEGRHRGASTRLRASWRRATLRGCGCW
ncbi:hypothetical protein JCM21900_001173 [Sporobolomyces salmonicolor]